MTNFNSFQFRNASTSLLGQNLVELDLFPDSPLRYFHLYEGHTDLTGDCNEISYMLSYAYTKKNKIVVQAIDFQIMVCLHCTAAVPLGFYFGFFLAFYSSYISASNAFFNCTNIS